MGDTTMQGHRDIAARLEAEGAQRLHPKATDLTAPAMERVAEAQAFALLAVSHRLAALDLNLDEDFG